jgi:pantoate--beta-alanine ligase
VLVVETSAELAAETAAARDGGLQVGFVPTMGALHDGHRALIAQARWETGYVVVSIFVNPLQFGPAEDFASYPRDLEKDLAVLDAEGVDLVFSPAAEELWPAPPVVRVSAGALAERLEGALRPGHLDGVATVVAKLFHLVGPSAAFFGQKDAQQLALVRRMVADLAFPQQIVACPTVREHDGLALSSRNAYLSAEDRARALALYRGLQAGLAAWRAGTTAPARIEQAAAAEVERTDGVELQYAALARPDTFEAPEVAAAGQVLAGAIRVGSTRLIDNVILG